MAHTFIIFQSCTADFSAADLSMCLELSSCGHKNIDAWMLLQLYIVFLFSNFT